MELNLLSGSKYQPKGGVMNYLDKYKSWIQDEYFDVKTREELLSIKDDEKEIEERFYKDLEFGTGGLRGIIGAGTNRINIYTVRKATMGLANYIIKKTGEEGKKRGVVIAHDSRFMSREFTLETAKTMAACGIKAYIFDGLRATPILSFAIRELGAQAGVVITASHNPPEYNGYKAYWEDGGQLVPEIANEVIKEVSMVEEYSSIPTMDEDEAKSKGLIEVLGKNIDDRFVEEVKKQSIKGEKLKLISKDFNIVYTPLHGTGNIPVRRVLEEMGFESVDVVEAQELPDPNFSTVGYPNPEDPKAFSLAIEMAKKSDAKLILGTDPDCDRVGALVKNDSGEYEVLTGNQTGALLLDYILSSKKENNTLPSNGMMVKTIVTSKMGDAIANHYGIKSMDTLTGFKFIGEKIKEFEETKEYEYIFGYEESYGYLAGTHARDKDAVVASMLIAEMAAYYESKGKGLYEALTDLYEKVGYYKEDLKSITLKGKDGIEKMQAMMDEFRSNPPKAVGTYGVQNVKDYSKGIEGLPKSNVLLFELEGESWFAIRPSGTEPKIKFYFSSKDDSMDHVDAKLKNIIDSLMEKVIKMQ